MPLPSSLLAVAPSALPTAAPEAPRFQQDWARAVVAFGDDLARGGYSFYTLRDYRTDVMRLGVYLDIAPESVGEEHVAQMEAFLAMEGLGEQARRRRTSAYRKFLDWRDGRLLRDPVAPRVLRASAALPWCDRVLIGLVYFAGLRLIEIAVLEGRDLKRRKGVVTTRRGQRHVPLHPRLVDLLNELKTSGVLAPYAPLIPGPQGFPVNPRTLHSRFHRLMQRIDCAGTKPEDLRRDAAMAFAHMNTPDGLIKAFLCKDRGRITAPRRGRMVDLECLRDRIGKLPV